MAPAGMRIQRDKQLALANCNGLLIRACDQLDDMMGRGAGNGLALTELQEVAPLAARVTRLRRHRRRLEAELHAITTEWALPS